MSEHLSGRVACVSVRNHKVCIVSVRELCFCMVDIHSLKTNQRFNGPLNRYANTSFSEFQRQASILKYNIDSAVNWHEFIFIQLILHRYTRPASALARDNQTALDRRECLGSRTWSLWMYGPRFRRSVLDKIGPHSFKCTWEWATGAVIPANKPVTSVCSKVGLEIQTSSVKCKKGQYVIHSVCVCVCVWNACTVVSSVLSKVRIENIKFTFQQQV